MLSVSEARQVLGKGCPLTDTEVAALTAQLYRLVALVIDETARSPEEELNDG